MEQRMVGTEHERTLPDRCPSMRDDFVVTDEVDVVHAFNDAINARDLDALTALMTDDHRFVDGEGAIVDGKVACTEAWRGFFAAFPDYRNVFDDVRSTAPGFVDVTGHSECSVA